MIYRSPIRSSTRPSHTYTKARFAIIKTHFYKESAVKSTFHFGKKFWAAPMYATSSVRNTTIFTSLQFVCVFKTKQGEEGSFSTPLRSPPTAVCTIG